MIKLTSLYKKTSKKGLDYMTGFLGKGVKLLVFGVKTKVDNGPDYDVFVEESAPFDPNRDSTKKAAASNFSMTD